MKKLLMVAVTAAALTACNNDKTVDSATIDSVNARTRDAMHTDSIAEAVAPATTIGAAEGDMMMKDGKMILMKGGQWVDMTETMSTATGTKVMTTGKLMMKDGSAMQMSNGETIKMSGELLNKEGKLITAPGKTDKITEKKQDTSRKM